MTTTTNPYPDVSLPADAVAEPDAWALFSNEFRVFNGADRVVFDASGRKLCEVCTAGVQYPDGSIDRAKDAPTISVYTYTDAGITGDQARELAAALLEAAAELDRWAVR